MADVRSRLLRPHARADVIVCVKCHQSGDQSLYCINSWILLATGIGSPDGVEQFSQADTQVNIHYCGNLLFDVAPLSVMMSQLPGSLVTDASPQGISASLYQEDEQGRWLPVDHISRALSQHEQAWKSQIEWESLAKMWGMTAFRPYLIGTKFTSWGDYQPLLPFYNDLILTQNGCFRTVTPAWIHRWLRKDA